MAQSDPMMRLLLALAGLIGAVGVASAAAASHAGESRNFMAIAAICLAHGPALLAISLAGRGKVIALAGILLASGTVVFSADLALRQWLGHSLIPGAAPLGGVCMIGGWLLAALSGVLRKNH